MPLFGHHNNATTATTHTGTGATHGAANPLLSHAPMDARAAAAATVPPTAGYSNTNTNTNTNAHHGRHTHGNAGGDPYANTVQNNEVTPVQHFSDGQRSGGANATVGKIEHAIGTMVGSQSLKAKGLQKEQQAQAFKAQSAEISEAERLEHEASLRRERAVGFGADPSHRHVGGGSAQAQEFGGNFGTMGPGSHTGNASGPGGRML